MSLFPTAARAPAASQALPSDPTTPRIERQEAQKQRTTRAFAGLPAVSFSIARRSTTFDSTRRSLRVATGRQHGMERRSRVMRQNMPCPVVAGPGGPLARKARFARPSALQEQPWTTSRLPSGSWVAPAPLAPAWTFPADVVGVFIASLGLVILVTRRFRPRQEMREAPSEVGPAEPLHRTMRKYRPHDPRTEAGL